MRGLAEPEVAVAGLESLCAQAVGMPLARASIDESIYETGGPEDERRLRRVAAAVLRRRSLRGMECIHGREPDPQI